MTDWGTPEHDQILVPTTGGEWIAFPLLNLLGVGARRLRSRTGFGMPPLHFLEQRGPFQDGASVTDLRYDTRAVQILVAETLWTRSTLYDRAFNLFDMLRPSRSFGAGTVQPARYKKWLPAGEQQRGSDMVADGTATVTSATGRFVHYGLEVGHAITIAGTPRTVTAVENDYTVTVNAAIGAATDINWEYTRGWGKRYLDILLEMGPDFDEGPGANPAWPQGYREALRFRTHNEPFWYGDEQSETWAIAAALGDLVFDGLGAWLGATAGVGRWLFAPTFVGETVNIPYWGTEDARPTIEIDGPATNPEITNTTLDLTISMEYVAIAGETVTIDVENVQVYNNLGDRLDSYASGDIATFALAPPGVQVEETRTNAVFVSFSGGLAGSSAARLLWRNKYTGLC